MREGTRRTGRLATKGAGSHLCSGMRSASVQRPEELPRGPSHQHHFLPPWLTPSEAVTVTHRAKQNLYFKAERLKLRLATTDTGATLGTMGGESSSHALM